MPRLFFSLLVLLLLTSCAPPQGDPAPEDGPPPSGCWSEVALPDAEEGTVILNGTHAFSERDVWAVGQRTLPDGQAVTLALRWDGSSWAVLPTPSLSNAPAAKSHL